MISSNIVRPGSQLSRIKTAIIDKKYFDIFLVTILGIAAGALMVLIRGQDTNPDLRNYHISSVYIWLHDRQMIDFAAGQMQGWFNPIGYLPAYGLIMFTSPKFASLTLATLQGFNAPLVYLIFHRATSRNGFSSRGIALASALIAVTGSMFLAEAGTTFLDTLVSIPVLGGILYMLRMISLRETRLDIGKGLMGGALIGAAVGLKLTGIVLVPGVVAATFIYVFGMPRWFTAFCAVAVGLAAGFAATAGWWHFMLWYNFGNPVFPLANSIFKSPWIDQSSLIDVRFLPQSIADYVLIPARAFVGTSTTSGNSPYLTMAEMPMRDVRYLVGLLVSAAGVIWMTIEKIRKKSLADDPLNFLAILFLLSFLVWMHVFGIARYAVVLESLSGGIVMMYASRTGVFNKWTLQIFPVLFVAGTHPPNWGHLPFDKSWFGEQTIHDLSSSNTTYVLNSSAFISYFGTYIPQSSRLVRISGNFPITPGYKLHDEAARLISTAPGPLRTLNIYPESFNPESSSALNQFKLKKDTKNCVIFNLKIENLISCPLTKVE